MDPGRGHLQRVSEGGNYFLELPISNAVYKNVMERASQNHTARKRILEKSGYVKIHIDVEVEVEVEIRDRDRERYDRFSSHLCQLISLENQQHGLQVHSLCFSYLVKGKSGHHCQCMSPHLSR